MASPHMITARKRDEILVTSIRLSRGFEVVKRSPELLTAIADKIASGILSQAAAARLCDVSVSSYWSFISQSQKSPADWIITYCDEQMPFHEAVKLARKIALHDVLGRYEQRMHSGTLEPVFFQGRPQWKEREDLAGCDDDTVKLLGYPDRYERDANGNRVQLMIRHEPPIAGVIKLLEANFPRQYGQRSEVNINQKIALGVTTVQRKPSPPVEVLPPRDVTPPQIEKPIDGDFTEEQEDLEALLGPEPEPAPPEAPAARELVQSAPVEPPAEEDMVSAEIGEPNGSPEPAPAAPAPAPTTAGRFGNLSPLQMEILAKLRAGVPASATTQPTAIVEKFSANDG